MTLNGKKEKQKAGKVLEKRYKEKDQQKAGERDLKISIKRCNESNEMNKK